MDGGRVRQLLSDAKSHADVGDMLLASQLYTKATEIDPEIFADAIHQGMLISIEGIKKVLAEL